MLVLCRRCRCTDSTHQAGNGEQTAGRAAGSAGTGQQIGRGVYGGGIIITPRLNTSASLTDSDFAAELNWQITAGHLPAPDANTIYMLHFPAGYSIDDGSGATSCNAFCAYHSAYVRNGASVYYAVIPDQAHDGCESGCGTSFDNTCASASHELFEAITDAEVGLSQSSVPPLGWYDANPDNNTNQGEVGDMCNQNTDVIADASGSWTGALLLGFVFLALRRHGSRSRYQGLPQ